MSKYILTEPLYNDCTILKNSYFNRCPSLPYCHIVSIRLFSFSFFPLFKKKNQIRLKAYKNKHKNELIFNEDLPASAVNLYLLLFHAFFNGHVFFRCVFLKLINSLSTSDVMMKKRSKVNKEGKHSMDQIVHK